MTFTIRPFRFLYLSAVAAVAWYNFGWLAAGLVFLASLDAVPRDNASLAARLNRERMGNPW